ncbi:MAG: DnaT-like ssDNA-binding protein [Candidatus Komeilibacteria bacterium]
MKFTHESSWFYKFTGETFDIEYDFTKDLTGGQTLSSCTASVYDSAGTDVTTTLIPSGTSVSTPDVTFTIVAGTAGETYEVKVAGVSSTSKIFVHYVTCEVYGSLTLNTKIGDISANSYVTLKEANDYIRNKYGRGNSWDTLDSNGKKRVLIQAAKDIDSFSFIEEKYYDSQALEHPRTNHEVVTGNCATYQAESTATLTDNQSFKNTGLKSDSYGEIQSNYWKYSTCHLTSDFESENVATSNRTGVIHLENSFTTNLTTSTPFKIFAPIDQNIKSAQCEQSLFLTQAERIDTLQIYKDLGAARIRIGDTEVEIKAGSSTRIALAPVARKLLGQFIKRSFKIGRG